MTKSLHLIHLGKKERGDVVQPKTTAPRILKEIRDKIVLPYRPEHIDTELLRKAVAELPK